MNRVFTLAFLTVLFVSTVRGDAIELKTGERVEGTFKQATSAGAVIEVAGQPITIPIEKLQAIYFGPAPPRSAAVSPPHYQEALDALTALRSLTKSGITYRDYAKEVLEARVKVDRYLSRGNEGTQLRSAIRVAMIEYELASWAWATKTDAIGNADLWKPMGDAMQDPAVAACPTVKAAIEMNDNPPASAPTRRRSPPARQSTMDRSTGLGSMLTVVESSPYWSLGNVTSGIWLCASKLVADGERSLAAGEERQPSSSTISTVSNSGLEQVLANSKAALASPASAGMLSPREQVELSQKGQASRCVVVTVPPGAEVAIDGRRAGVSPVAFMLLKRGDTPRVLTIMLDGYKSMEESIVPDGKPISVAVTLEKP